MDIFSCSLLVAGKCGKARPGQPGFHRSLLDTEGERDFGIGHPLHFAQQQDFPLLGGKPAQDAVEQFDSLPVGNLLIRLGSGGLKIGARPVDTRFRQRNELDAPPSPQLVERRVMRDTEQPGLELRLRAPPGQRLMGLHERVLGEIHGLVAGIAQAQDKAKDTILVAPDQQAKSAVLASLGADKLEESFDEAGLRLRLRLPAAMYPDLERRLRDLSRGAATLEPIETEGA